MPNRFAYPVPARTPLASIITAARAGGLDHAWSLFRDSGYDARGEDAAALAVKGRLLKDGALRAAPAERAAAFRAAADAYRAADGLAPQPYTRINVATLTLLGGDQAHACAIARTLLDELDGGGPIAETPYYIAATRAEALLLCGDVAAAEAALATAVAHDPDGWIDRASTLRQFALILDATAGPSAWLDAYRPPRSLHFAGHLGVGEAGAGPLRARIAAVLADERIGFGFGALAAGADIVLAEALLAAGAELHVVLPTGIDAFAAQSVTPYGPGWRARFEACLAAATSMRTMTAITGAYEPLATQLAADVAMGSAALNARQLESEAVQLLVIDDGGGAYGAGLGTARDGERWAAAGVARQHVLMWPRVAGVLASGHRAETEGRPDRRLAAILHIAVDGLDAADEGVFADAVDQVLIPLRERMASLAPQPQVMLPAGNARIVAFETPQRACAYAHAVLASPIRGWALRIAGHYALAHWLDTPAALVGRGIAELDIIAAAAMPGVLTVSETMASALFIPGAGDLHAEWVGETNGTRLFAVTAR